MFRVLVERNRNNVLWSSVGEKSGVVVGFLCMLGRKRKSCSMKVIREMYRK